MGAAGSLRDLTVPFAWGSAVLSPQIHIGRDPGWMGVILSCWLPALEGGASILYQTSVSVSAVSQTWGAQFLEHWNPEHLVQGAVLYCSAFPESKSMQTHT